jgi:hypothetical protein
MKMLKRAHCSKTLSTRSQVSGVGGAAEKMNIERPTSNFEWEKMKKQKESLLQHSNTPYPQELVASDLDFTISSWVNQSLVLCTNTSKATNQ